MRDPDAAEDILQDVYLKIHSRIHTLQDEEKIRAWVYRVAHNAVNDHHRARRPATELEETTAIQASPDAELQEQLSGTVRNMLEGLTQKELAERLGSASLAPSPASSGPAPVSRPSSWIAATSNSTAAAERSTTTTGSAANERHQPNLCLAINFHFRYILNFRFMDILLVT